MRQAQILASKQGPLKEVQANIENEVMVTPVSTSGPVPMAIQSVVSALQQAFEQNKISQRQHGMVMKVHSVANVQAPIISAGQAKRRRRECKND